MYVAERIDQGSWNGSIQTHGWWWPRYTKGDGWYMITKLDMA